MSALTRRQPRPSTDWLLMTTSVLPLYTWLAVARLHLTLITITRHNPESDFLMCTPCLTSELLHYFELVWWPGLSAEAHLVLRAALLTFCEYCGTQHWLASSSSASCYTAFCFWLLILKGVARPCCALPHRSENRNPGNLVPLKTEVSPTSPGPHRNDLQSHISLGTGQCIQQKSKLLKLSLVREFHWLNYLLHLTHHKSSFKEVSVLSLHSYLTTAQHSTYNMKSCSQHGWSPRTATVVLFTFCTFRVTYVLNLSGEQEAKSYLLQFTISPNKHNISRFSVHTLHPRGTKNQKPR